MDLSRMKIQSKILKAKMEASYWSRAQNRGLSLVERTQGQKSKALTLIQNSLSFSPRLIIPMKKQHPIKSFLVILTSFHTLDDLIGCFLFKETAPD